MNKQLECVDALKDVRRYMHHDADPRILAALDLAIAKLEGCIAEERTPQHCWAEAVTEALVVIGEIVTCCNAVAGLVKHFGS
jgi:signal transduction histidine kinase